MKVKANEMILFGSLFLVLLTPLFPKVLIEAIVGNRVGAFIVLCLVLYTFKKNMILGLAAFLASAALFLEYRRRTIDTIRMSFFGSKQVGVPVKKLSKPAKDLIPGEVHPSSEDPSIEESGYEPSHGSEEEGSYSSSHESGEFYESAAIESDKVPLETVPSNNSGGLSQMFLAKGLASLTNQGPLP